MSHRGRWIFGALLSSSLLLIITAFAGLMQLILNHLGDEVGVRVAQGTVVVTGIGFLAGHILLVTLLALRSIESNMERVSLPEGRPPA